MQRIFATCSALVLHGVHQCNLECIGATWNALMSQDVQEILRLPQCELSPEEILCSINRVS